MYSEKFKNDDKRANSDNNEVKSDASMVKFAWLRPGPNLLVGVLGRWEQWV